MIGKLILKEASNIFEHPKAIIENNQVVVIENIISKGEYMLRGYVDSVDIKHIYTLSENKVLPLHPDDYEKAVDHLGEDVELKQEEGYVRLLQVISKTKKQEKRKTWENIVDEFKYTKEYDNCLASNYYVSFFYWLKTNYNVPTKKSIGFYK